MTIRDQIIAAMQTQGLSQRRLAHLAGIPQPAINRYLRGHVDMNGRNLERLLDVMGLALGPSGERADDQGVHF